MAILASIIYFVCGCGKAVTVIIVNRSSHAILIDDQKRVLSCEPHAMVALVPCRTSHDLAIRAGGKTFLYDFEPMPPVFLDQRKGRKRVVLVFAEDRKLYLLHPTDRPLDEVAGNQPPAYPLCPRNE